MTIEKMYAKYKLRKENNCTMLGISKVNSLNIFTYLESLLMYMPYVDWKNHPEDLDNLMQWSDSVQAERKR